SLYSEGLPISGSGHRLRRGGVSRKPELTSLFWSSVISEAGKTDDLPAQTGSCQVCAPLFSSPALSAQLLEINELSAAREALKEAFPWGMSLQLSRSMIDICAHLIRSLRPMAWQHNELLLLLLSPKSTSMLRSLQWRGAELILAHSLHVGAEMIGASCSEVMIDQRCDIPAVCQQHPLTALFLARCSNTVIKESVLTKHLCGQPWSNEALCHFSTAYLPHRGASTSRPLFAVTASAVASAFRYISLSKQPGVRSQAVKLCCALTNKPSSFTARKTLSHAAKWTRRSEVHQTRQTGSLLYPLLQKAPRPLHPAETVSQDKHKAGPPQSRSAQLSSHRASNLLRSFHSEVWVLIAICGYMGAPVMAPWITRLLSGPGGAPHKNMISPLCCCVSRRSTNSLDGSSYFTGSRRSRATSPSWLIRGNETQTGIRAGSERGSVITA
ncbi:hypothetical protein KUCAC02_026428, partial [Chaenocephalus aceratus]